MATPTKKAAAKKAAVPAPKKAAAKKATVPAKKVAANLSNNTAPKRNRKPVTKPSDNVPHIALTAGKTGEIVRIPLSGDVLDAVLDVVARQSATVAANATGRVTLTSNNYDDGTQAVVISGKGPAQQRNTALSSRIDELRSLLGDTAITTNRFSNISGLFFGENAPQVELPTLSNADTNLIGQFDELIKWLRLYNANQYEIADRLANII